MSRTLAIGVAAFFLTLGALGCERREPTDPHEFVAAETARIVHASPAPGPAPAGAHVSCRCDADAGLHVVAPEGSIVTTPPDAVGTDAEADIVVANDQDDVTEAPGTRLRHSVSLGFAGDGKLTQIDPGGYYDDGGFWYPPTPYYGGRPHGYFRPAVGPRGGFHSGGFHSGGLHSGGFHGGGFHGGGFHGGGFHGGGFHGGHGR